jgi:hypothetical protein
MICATPLILVAWHASLKKLLSNLAIGVIMEV